MKSTKEKREERINIVDKFVKDIQKLYEEDNTEFSYKEEVWTETDSKPLIDGKAGIQITVSWREK